MASRIVVFGATGYTGRLIAERLVAAGVRPVLAGRTEERVDGAGRAARRARIRARRRDAGEHGLRRSRPADVLISTVGPFLKWGLPAVRAAVAAGCTYLDSTGEPEFIRRVFEEFGPPAERSGAALLTAMGYDFAPGALAGALALAEAGPDAVRVDVGYYALGGGPSSLSAGTRESLVGATLGDGHAYRDGRVRHRAPGGAGAVVRGRRPSSREAISVGGAEHFALPAAYPGLREVNVYLGWFGPLARPLQAGSFAGSWVRRVPGVRPAMRIAGERALGLARRRRAGRDGRRGSRPRRTTRPVGRCRGAPGGRRRLRVHGVVHGVGGAADVSGAGALGPVEAFGLAAFEEGAAWRGWSACAERVRPGGGYGGR